MTTPDEPVDFEDRMFGTALVEAMETMAATNVPQRERCDRPRNHPDVDAWIFPITSIPGCFHVEILDKYAIMTDGDLHKLACCVRDTAGTQGKLLAAEIDKVLHAQPE